MSDVLISVDNVSKKFCRSLKKSLWYGVQDMAGEMFGSNTGRDLRPDEFWAAKDVSFELKRGECLGLIGRNGAGKTTLLRMLNGLIKPDGGRIEMRGRIGALIALGAGFNPILTGRENIHVNAAVLGLSRHEIDQKMGEIIDFAEIDGFIDTPVQSYSSGMTVRLGFAIATALKPDILILDEVLAVGDANFQAKCFQRIGEVTKNSAVILVSHSAHHIKKMCDRAVLLERGKTVMKGDADSVLAFYQQGSEAETQAYLAITCGDVKGFKLENTTEFLITGGYLGFDFILDMVRAVDCNQSYLNIVDHTDCVHAQVCLTGLEKTFPTGESRFRVSIGPLYLSAGNYSVNFSCCGEGGKTTIAHLRHCMHFRFEGPQSLGPVYYPPSTVSHTPQCSV